MKPDQKALKAQVDAALARISNEQDATALKRLHANIHRHAEIEDIDRERLDEAVMQRLRIVSPGLATRLGGPKDAQAREFLETFYRTLSEKFDLSGNQLKNGVKTGGNMINGSKYVDVYISYKTPTGKNLSLAWLQDDVESKPYLHLLFRNLRAGEKEVLLSEKLEDQEKATEAYTRKLEELLKTV